MTIHWQDLNTAGKIDAIKTVYQPGMSANEIACAIGGISRNAIIGMYGRYSEHLTDCGLRPYRTSGRPSANGAPSKKATKALLRSYRMHGCIPKPKAEKIVRASVPEPHVAGRPLMALNARECRWAVNEAEPGELHLFCGLPTERTYCEHHNQRAVGSST